MGDILNVTYVTWDEVALRMAVASVLGLIIGIDRELKQKPIGMRAFMLVSLGSAAFGLITMELAYLYDNLVGVAKIDPSRVIQGVIGGIGFLGAGAIIQSQGEVRGTGTGASIWCVGSIGLACGFGFYWHAIAATTIAMIILTIIGVVRRYLRNSDMADQYSATETSHDAE